MVTRLVKYLMFFFMLVSFLSCGVKKVKGQRVFYKPRIYQNFGNGFQLIDLMAYGEPTNVKYIINEEDIYENIDRISFTIQGNYKPISSDSFVDIKKVVIYSKNKMILSTNFEKKFFCSWLFEDTIENRDKYFDSEKSHMTMGNYLGLLTEDENLGRFQYIFRLNKPIKKIDHQKIEIFYMLENGENGSVIFEVDEIDHREKIYHNLDKLIGWS